MKYYEAHKKDFVKPEQVALRAIEISTTGKTDSELPDLKKKADDMLRRIKDGRISRHWRNAFPTAAPRSRAATSASTSAANFPSSSKTRSSR